MERRKFIKQSLLAASSASLILPTSCTGSKLIRQPDDSHPTYDELKPLDKVYDWINTPVIIKDIRLLEYASETLIKVTTTDGVVGYALGNGRHKSTVSLFEKLVAPYFIGKDARALGNMHEEYYYNNQERVYKYVSMPIWNAFGAIEVAVLDILGKICNKNVRDLLGTTIRTKIPVYMSSLRRDTTAEKECAWLKERIDATGAKAVKIKIGGRMSRNKDAFPGRTEQLVPMARKVFGDDCHIYVDSNGSYDVPKAIEIGKWLQNYNIGFYEEPVEWMDFEGTKKVADALQMVVAGGEQDHDWYKWLWMIDHKALDLIQPDLMYNGGILRTIRVANYAAKKGIQVTTHNPRNNSEYANLLALAAVLPNLGPFQEFRAELPKTKIPYTPNIECKDGEVSVLTYPGMGISYDDDFVKQMNTIVLVDKGFGKSID